MGLFDHFFKVEEAVDEAGAALEDARIAASFGEHPYYRRFIVWLEHEADRRIAVNTDAQTMISGIARQNTLKEVRDHLRDELRQASATIDRAREDHNG